MMQCMKRREGGREDASSRKKGRRVKLHTGEQSHWVALNITQKYVLFNGPHRIVFASRGSLIFLKLPPCNVFSLTGMRVAESTVGVGDLAWM
jgi:hypothetical protein